jgi:hypothetical protein
MSKALTKTDAAKISKAIADAEKGRATLSQLAEAHAMAEAVGAHRTLGVLRDHIRRLTPGPPLRNEAKSIALGCISGIITWFILGRTRDAAS